MRIDDLVITIAYFSISVQILVSLYHYPLLSVTPRHLLMPCVLFALFISLCGACHLMHALGQTGTHAQHVINICTAVISTLTAIYLLPVVPHIKGSLDKLVQDLKVKEEMEETKNQKLMTFMGFLCHEIRNPLFAITTNIAFISDGEDEMSDDQKNSLNSIRQSANLMLRIVNDVLDISKLEKGKLELEDREFDLHEMLSGVTCGIHCHMKYKHPTAVSFHCQIAENVPRIVYGDSARILQIVYNLLSNASKFTERGCVEFSATVCDFSEAVARGNVLSKSQRTISAKDFDIRLLEAAEDGTAKHNAETSSSVVLKITVKDTGPGISSEHINFIFEPFSQAKLSDYRKHGGTGLGLAIIAKVAENMGGTIQVESALNEGSTFIVYLPIVVPHQPKTSMAVDPLAIMKNSFVTQLLPELSSDFSLQSSLDQVPNNLVSTNEEVDKIEAAKPCEKRMSGVCSNTKTSKHVQFNFPSRSSVVLIVDDNAINRKLLGRMLSGFNLETDFACDGQEAVDIMCKSRNLTGNPDAPQYALIFMDMSMPVMDGRTAIMVLRNQKKLDIPIVVLTANALESHSQEAISAGATEFATKPIIRDDLYRICCKYMPQNTLVQKSTTPSAEKILEKQ